MTVVGETVQMMGGFGYIGSHLIKQLFRKGYFPATHDNLFEGHLGAVTDGNFIRGDLSDTEKLSQVLEEYDIEAVIHFAANAYVAESVEGPKKYFDNNVSDMINLLNTALEKEVDKFIFPSSYAVKVSPKIRHDGDSPHPLYKLLR